MADDVVHESASGAMPPRLLPWSEYGKPCWLAPASEGGFLSQLADTMEAVQMHDGRAVLAQARGLLEKGDKLGPQELRFVACRLAESLSYALRVAESRGIRLGIVDPDDITPDDGTEELKAGE